MSEAIKDASALYEVERRARYGARPGFHITELQISPSQKVPWHYHNNIHDTFYVVEGTLRIFLQQPKEEVRLARGQTFSVPPKRPHLVTRQRTPASRSESRVAQCADPRADQPSNRMPHRVAHPSHLSVFSFD